MPIEPAHLARSLGALDTVDLAQGLARTLQQVLRSAKTLLDADRAGLMLVDQAGALRWASASDRAVEAHEGDPDRLAQGPCTTAFAQRAPAAVPELSAEPGRPALAQVGIEDGNHGALSVPVHVGGGPVGTLDVHVTAPREWDDSQVAALQTYAGLVARVLAAAVTARVRGRLADQLQGALEHRLLIEQAEAVLIDREGLDAQAAFEWLRTAARSSGCAVVEVAREVLGGAPLPSDRLAQAKARRHEAIDREVAVHRPPPGLRPARGRGPTLRAARPGWSSADRASAGGAARGRITDAEPERRRADQAS